MTPDQVLFALTRGRPTAITADEWPPARARLVAVVAEMEARASVLEHHADWILACWEEINRRDAEFGAP